MPVLIALQLLLRDVPLPPLAKMPLALVATIAVLLPLYRYGVRPTFVGAVLNGPEISRRIRTHGRHRWLGA